MSIHLQRDLDNLQRQILSLGGLVEAAIFKATNCWVRLAGREDLAGRWKTGPGF